MSLVPGRVLGAELAAILAIFTSQAWNMAAVLEILADHGKCTGNIERKQLRNGAQLGAISVPAMQP